MQSVSSKIKFIESIFGAGKLSGDGKNIDVRCPRCAPSDRSKRKLAIRVADDRNHCWKCGWRARSLVPLLRKFAGQASLNEYVTRFTDGSVLRKTALAPEIDTTVEQRPSLPNDFRLLVTLRSNDPDVRAARKYLVRRNISERELWKYRLGVSEEYRWHRRVIVPSFDSRGRLNYFVARAVDSARQPRYDNPKYDKLSIVFNEINVNWSSQLVLCEGVFDMFNCGDNVVPLLGSDINEESALFTAILANNTPIALALDDDMWYTKTPKVVRKLTEYGIDVVVVDTRPFGDPGSASKQQFRDALEAAQPYGWDRAMRSRLEMIV